MFHKAVAVRIAYGSMSLFIAILHNVFLLYYVDIFVSVYKIDRNSFWLGEVSGFILIRISLNYLPCFDISTIKSKMSYNITDFTTKQ